MFRFCSFERDKGIGVCIGPLPVDCFGPTARRPCLYPSHGGFLCAGVMGQKRRSFFARLIICACSWWASGTPRTWHQVWTPIGNMAICTVVFLGIFFWSAPIAFRRVALETPEWTSRDSNHHWQSVSAGKTNAIATEPSVRLASILGYGRYLQLCQLLHSNHLAEWSVNMCFLSASQLYIPP